MTLELLAGVVAVSAAMREVLDLATRLAEAKSAVLIEGESGTGKDLLAHWLHYKGSRRDGPFIKVHCPSIPAELLESELFGHEKGAFTDARSAKLGKLELAHTGTLFFDQIEDLSLPLQAKLLRAVEERRFERLGGNRTLEVDVRFVSAARSDLRQAVAAGYFRDDLYHRLSVVPLRIPPLRERRDDILPLAQAFLRLQRERRTTAATDFEPAAAEALKGYSWPGNVRELRSAVEYAAFQGAAGAIPRHALPELLLGEPATLWQGQTTRPSLKAIEQAYIRHVLREVSDNQTQAAAILGISRKVLWEKRRRYGIS